MSPPVFLADTGRLAADQVILDGAEGRHAATVRRLRPGERVDLTDGAGLLAECLVGAAGRDTLTLDVLARHRRPAPEPRLVIVQALPKGDRGELAVEMMTEVGVDEIVPWAAGRSITRWRPERRAKALARWRGTAREAAKQARRTWFPAISDLAGTAEVAARIRAAAGAIVLHEAAADALSALPLPRAGEPAEPGKLGKVREIVAVVGPEGGITDEELAEFAAAGARPARLGRTVLRTSTAGVAAAAILLTATGRW